MLYFSLSSPQPKEFPRISATVPGLKRYTSAFQGRIDHLCIFISQVGQSLQTVVGGMSDGYRIIGECRVCLVDKFAQAPVVGSAVSRYSPRQGQVSTNLIIW